MHKMCLRNGAKILIARVRIIDLAFVPAWIIDIEAAKTVESF